MYNSVFISYAKEDYQRAEELYDFLDIYGFKPWLDKKKLLPGQNWEHEINTALRKADYIILLLSNISIRKRGFVQKEFKIALDYCKEKLESDIYIIPLKLTNCDVPIELSKYQWVEYTDEEFHPILRALEFQRDVLIKDRSALIPSNIDLSYDECIKNYYIHDNPALRAEIIYPQFKNKNSESLEELNAIIKYDVFHQLLFMRKEHIHTHIRTAREMEKTDDYDKEGMGMLYIDSTLDTKYHMRYISEKIISLSFFKSIYQTGAAHGYYWTEGRSYYLNPLIEIEIEELFDNDTIIAERLHKIISQKLLARAKKEFNLNEQDGFYLPNCETSWENFKNYYLTNTSIWFIFNPYQVSAYAYGDHFIEITFSELIQELGQQKESIETINKFLEVFN